jgi:hypothetical protein
MTALIGASEWGPRPVDNSGHVDKLVHEPLQ